MGIRFNKLYTRKPNKNGMKYDVIPLNVDEDRVTYQNITVNGEKTGPHHTLLATFNNYFELKQEPIEPVTLSEELFII